jgi:hypothetical protein
VASGGTIGIFVVWPFAVAATPVSPPETQRLLA